MPLRLVPPALPQGLGRFSPLAVSVTPQTLVVKMPRSAPAGWRNADPLVHTVASRTDVPLPTGIPGQPNLAHRSPATRRYPHLLTAVTPAANGLRTVITGPTPAFIREVPPAPQTSP